MISMHGYEKYDMFCIWPEFFNSANLLYPRTFLMNFPCRTNKKVRMVEDNNITTFLSDCDSKTKVHENGFFRERMHTPADGEALYFDKACTIPRMKCEGKWKRVIKVTNADVVVVPNFTPMRKRPHGAVFVDDTIKRIYVIDNCSDIKHQPKLGETMGELIQENTSCISASSLSRNVSSVTTAANARCVYIGSLMIYDPSKEFVFKIIEGVYPKFVFEGDLLRLLGTEENKFTPESVQGLMDLLGSPDKGSVLQGMRTLANMDYDHYPSVTKYILKTKRNNWEKYKPFNSDVKFMLDYLGIGSGYGYLNTPFESVTREEFPIVRDIVIGIYGKELEKTIALLRSTTNLLVDFDYNLDIRFNDPQVEDSRECVEDDDEDDDDDDDWVTVDGTIV